MVLVVQDISGTGQKLEVVVPDDNKVIVENGNYSIEYGDTGKLLITPSLVRQLIIESLKLGWKPNINSSPARLHLIQGKLDIWCGI